MAIVIIAFAARLILISIAEDMTSSVNTFNENTKENENEPETIQKFNKLIHFHSDVKQLSTSFNSHFYSNSIGDETVLVLWFQIRFLQAN